MSITDSYNDNAAYFFGRIFRERSMISSHPMPTIEEFLKTESIFALEELYCDFSYAVNRRMESIDGRIIECVLNSRLFSDRKVNVGKLLDEMVDQFHGDQDQDFHPEEKSLFHVIQILRGIFADVGELPAVDTEVVDYVNKSVIPKFKLFETIRQAGSIAPLLRDFRKFCDIETLERCNLVALMLRDMYLLKTERDLVDAMEFSIRQAVSVLTSILDYEEVVVDAKTSSIETLSWWLASKSREYAIPQRLHNLPEITDTVRNIASKLGER